MEGPSYKMGQVQIFFFTENLSNKIFIFYFYFSQVAPHHLGPSQKKETITTTILHVTGRACLWRWEILLVHSFDITKTQWQKKKGNPKQARRINAERKHRRLEKKENWKTQKKQGKDKVYAFHFYFILWTWCVLGLHFRICGKDER